MSTLSFCGAAGTVTGSCTRLEAGAFQLLVDCGLFQGNATVRRLNDEPFPFDPAAIDALLLTHAHTDHAGLVPKLVRDGFAGPVFATEATADLLGFMLRDSARIQETEAERAARRSRRRGEPAEPPRYTMADAEAALERIRPVAYDTWLEPIPDVHVRFWNAGHILGSASIELKYREEATGHWMRLMFSGDLGPDEKAFHPEPEAEQGFDYVVCEATYGDRERADYTLASRRAALRRELSDGLARGGNVVVPCFAVERSQELLHDIGVLLAEEALPRCRVFLDSPLARRVTEVFIRHADALEDLDVPEDRLFRDPRFHIVESVEESKAINRVSEGAIIVSASGMAEAGRIVHHLKNNVWRKEATVLFVGYQAPGTTGAHILSGAEDVFLHGKRFRIRARIREIGNYSAHADQSELVDWILARRPIAGGLFLNHGDDDARTALADMLAERGLERARIFRPGFDERFDLTAGTPESKGRTAERIDPDELLHDWGEAYEALELDLESRLLDAPSDAARMALIRQIEEALARADTS
jgi:metallo-beta-lactamase family protein